MNAPRPDDGSPAGQKLVCFEAIRGLAAVAVLVGHVVLCFWPGVYFRGGLNWNELPGVLRFLATFPGKSLWDGHMAVSVFFVLSGFVLSLAFFHRPSAPALGSAAVRRYPRLMIPIAASVLLAYTLMVSGAMCNQTAVRYMNQSQGLPRKIDFAAKNGHSNKWLATHYAFAPSFPAALREGTWGAFTTIPMYNLVLWTMPIELVGSFLVYGSLALFGTFRNRWLLYALGGCLLVFNDRVFLFDFVLGMALCDLWVHNQRTWQKSLSLRWAIALIALGVFLVPWKPLAALLVVGAAAASPRLQEVLSASWLAFLGRISFSLYLVHMPILCSVGCGLFLLFCRDLGWSYAAGAGTAVLVAVLVSVLVAWVFYHVFDRSALVLTRRADVWLFREKKPHGEVAPAVVSVPHSRAA